MREVVERPRRVGEARGGRLGGRARPLDHLGGRLVEPSPVKT